VTVAVTEVVPVNEFDVFEAVTKYVYVASALLVTTTVVVVVVVTVVCS